MITTAIVFDHRNRTAKNEEGPLEIRITVNRKAYYLNTGVRVKSRQWAFDKVVNHEYADGLNRRLGILVGKVMDELNEMLSSGTQFNIERLRRNVWGMSVPEECVVMEWLDAEVTKLGVKAGTLNHYRSVMKRVREYGKFRAWRDVTVAGIYDFDAWLRKLPGRTSRICGGTRYNYHKCLRALLSRAERDGIIPFNPYGRMRGAFPKDDRENTEYLTEDEMQMIEAFSPAPGSAMERARDLFIFQMYTGLSYSDTQTFDISAYKKVDGKWRITGSRIKTGKPFVNQLLPPAVAVLERYGMRVPKISNQVYNRELKQVGIAAGITFPLHSHLARHTFATYMLSHGVKIENLSRMLGHTNVKQTLRYAKVLAKSVHEDFDMIERLIRERDGGK